MSSRDLSQLATVTIRKAVHFLLSCNVSEVLVMLIATLLGLPLPLQPIQILRMNLVTDRFPALALAVDPKAPGKEAGDPVIGRQQTGGDRRGRVDAECIALGVFAIQAAVLTIPVAAPIFKVASLPIEDWVLMGGMSLCRLSSWRRSRGSDERNRSSFFERVRFERDLFLRLDQRT